MNEIMKSGGPSTTMTSREMADLTEKRHDNVKRTIDTLVEKGVISQPQIEDGEKSSNGTVEKLYKIGKRDSYIIVAQLSPEFTARLVDRWQELEAKPTLSPANLSRMQLIELAMQAEQERLESEQKCLALECVVATQAPKVEALDRIATSDGSMCITDSAKTLQVQPRKLTQLLQENGWVYRRPMGSGWLAYQDKIQQGLMEHKVTTGEKGDGTEWTSTQPRITSKGLTKLAAVIQQAGTH
jgi:phage antirepressor YoqD-like protein